MFKFTSHSACPLYIYAAVNGYVATSSEQVALNRVTGHTAHCGGSKVYLFNDSISDFST